MGNTYASRQASASRENFRDANEQNIHYAVTLEVYPPHTVRVTVPVSPSIRADFTVAAYGFKNENVNTVEFLRTSAYLKLQLGIMSLHPNL